MRLPNGEDKIQCSNYVKNWKLCGVSLRLYEPLKCSSGISNLLQKNIEIHVVFYFNIKMVNL